MPLPHLTPAVWAIIAIFAVIILTPLIARAFLRDVEAGTIRLVSWLNGAVNIYKGPGKSKEFPLVTVGTSIPSRYHTARNGASSSGQCTL